MGYERVAAVGLEPDARGGTGKRQLTDVGDTCVRAAPLRSLALEVGSRERPASLFAGRHVLLPDRAPVSPGGIRVAVPLTLRAVLRKEPLPVCVGGKVGRVDGDIFPKLWKFHVERRNDPGEAGVQQRRVRAELRGEAIAGPLRGS